MEKEILFSKIKTGLYWLIYIALMWNNLVIFYYVTNEWYYIITDYDYWCDNMTMFRGGNVPLGYHVYGLYLTVINFTATFLGSWMVYKKKKYALWVVAIDFFWLIVCELLSDVDGLWYGP